MDAHRKDSLTRKHLAERRRRAKINYYLDEIEEMIAPADSKTSVVKMEKAELLEKTAAFLKALHSAGFNIKQFHRQVVSRNPKRPLTALSRLAINCRYQQHSSDFLMPFRNKHTFTKTLASSNNENTLTCEAKASLKENTTGTESARSACTYINVRDSTESDDDGDDTHDGCDATSTRMVLGEKRAGCSVDRNLVTSADAFDSSIWRPWSRYDPCAGTSRICVLETSKINVNLNK